MDESPALLPGHPRCLRGQSLGEFSAGRRNSQCINMQKRCINCFSSFRKLQYLNNVISLLTSQYICFKGKEELSTHLLIIRYTRPLTLAWL
uniref:Uncharacterized protein n=1 Tax=Catharus ustulatus TaxID=91951 RepID=A0A8C3TUS3_CATUS